MMGKQNNHIQIMIWDIDSTIPQDYLHPVQRTWISKD